MCAGLFRMCARAGVASGAGARGCRRGGRCTAGRVYYARTFSRYSPRTPACLGILLFRFLSSIFVVVGGGAMLQLCACACCVADSQRPCACQGADVMREIKVQGPAVGALLALASDFHLQHPHATPAECVQFLRTHAAPSPPPPARGRKMTSLLADEK